MKPICILFFKSKNTDVEAWPINGVFQEEKFNVKIMLGMRSGHWFQTLTYF